MANKFFSNKVCDAILTKNNSNELAWKNSRWVKLTVDFELVFGCYTLAKIIFFLLHKWCDDYFYNKMQFRTIFLFFGNYKNQNCTTPLFVLKTWHNKLWQLSCYLFRSEDIATWRELTRLHQFRSVILKWCRLWDKGLLRNSMPWCWKLVRLHKITIDHSNNKWLCSI